MTHWVMVADLERCVGCQTCTAACRHTNATSPAVQWRKVLDIEAGSYPQVSRTFVPVGCQHCADPPCMHVCPTTATRQRPDGIVTIDYDICIGCAYCEVACPYQARFLDHEGHFAYGAMPTQNEVERVDPARFGVAQKCTFCSDRIDFGLENGLTPGIDPRATPACVNACIADALHFGDIDDPASNVSRLIREHKTFRMHEELGTDPHFHYLYDRSGAPATNGATGAQPAAGRIRTRGVEPAHQQHWDWKAAGNFLAGGAGSGLFAFLTLGGVSHDSARLLGLGALGLIALGLALLLFKIGRPFRFIHVLRQPQRSWMTREAWVVFLFFPLALLALWTGWPVLTGAAAVVALIFLYCQAMILREAKGIPAWRNQRIVPLIVATGIAEGGGLYLIAAVLLPALASLASSAALAVLAFAIARAFAWRNYLAALEQEGAPTRTLQVLRGFSPWLHGLGVAAPVALIGAGLAAPAIAPLAYIAAGLLAFWLGWALKFILVTRAAYNQGFALKHTPVRGAGSAGGAVKPGWIMP